MKDTEAIRPKTLRERSLTVLGTFVFLVILEAIFMGAVMITFVIIPWELLFLLDVYGVMIMGYILFVGITVGLMSVWKRIVKNQETRVWSLVTLTGILSLMLPVHPLSLNLEVQYFFLGINMVTWPIIFGVGVVLVVLSYLDLKGQRKMSSWLILILALIVFIAYFDVYPTLTGSTNPLINQSLSPFWLVTQMGGLVLLLEILLPLLSGDKN